MSRFKTQVPPEKFKTMAKKVTETLVDKEMRAKKVKHFTGLDDKSKKGAKKWVMEYMTRHGYKPVGKEKGGEDEKDEGDDVEGEADMEVDTTPQDQDDGAADSSVESDLGEQVGASDLERSSPQKPPLPVSDGLSQEDFN